MLNYYFIIKQTIPLYKDLDMNKKLKNIAIKILNKYKKTFKKLAEYEHTEKELCKQGVETLK